LVCRQALRFKKHLMTGLIGETMNLILNRWAISRTNALNLALLTVHGRSVQTCANNVMGPLVGMSDPTRELLRVHSRTTQIRKNRHRIRVARLDLRFGEVDSTRVDSWRRARLQATLR